MSTNTPNPLGSDDSVRAPRQYGALVSRSRRSAVYADLHLHTTVSDGQLPPERIPLAARRAGLRAVALTDHDRFHPDRPPVVRRAGVTVVHGIELRVDAGQPVDLLGYGVRPTDALREEVERLSADRIDRGRRIIACVEDRLDVELAVEPRPGLGRPHIARAIAAHPDTGLDFQGAFDELIADGRPCYVPRAVPDFDRGRRLLADACELVVLAHPLRYDDPTAALDRAPALDGVELRYPYDNADLAPVRAVIQEHDLVATGGSDAHDDRLGTRGLTPREFRPVARRLGEVGD